ncbi:hypothetical protein M0R88_09825 [Halorussus gelatinilyticus]|uniref:Uncharacterized protein n=1 Tax=Halorussus gelatinilyticus TaxID=2937524 RepID=A0A8U0IDP9_9EURY|nr:hypothetical protein [Halorussus gelatinilyticus]UPV98830.1 hypothetical protein M0R88_09825 [Halorussus gelatinilyticus]
MRHEHLVVTVEADTKARIDERLDGGESLEAWVADAIERKLDDEHTATDDDAAARFGDAAADTDPDDSDSDRDGSDRFDFDRDRADASDSGPADFVPRDDDSGADRDDGDDYDEGFEYVDDCSI